MSDAGSDQDGNLTADTVFTTLSNPRRRYVLQYLSEVGEETTLRELSEQVAAWENDKTVQQLDRKERRRVYTALQQTHLPQMSETGIVIYDRDRGNVRLTDHARDLRIYMEILQGNEIPWSEYYLALAAVCGGLVTAAWLGVFPGSIPDLAYAGVIVALFGVSAGVNVVVMRRRRMNIVSEEEDDRQASGTGSPDVSPEAVASDTGGEE